jgi:hypothetical protein
VSAAFSSQKTQLHSFFLLAVLYTFSSSKALVAKISRPLFIAQLRSESELDFQPVGIWLFREVTFMIYASQCICAEHIGIN